MLGESAVGSVEDKVVLVDASGDRLGTEFLETTEKGFGIGDRELDFDFAGHEEIVREEGEKRDIRYRISDIRKREEVASVSGE